MNCEEIITGIEAYVTDFLASKLSPQLTFHNLQHTLEVVSATKEIGAYSNLNKEQFNIAIAAAWFHDCGYAITYKGHENESKRIAGEYLQQHSCPQDFISAVQSCIEATRYPQKPFTDEAKVLCDADLYHFTKTAYPRYEEALRNEFNIYLPTHFSKEEWKLNNCSVLESHQYHTDYGKNVLQQFKEVNLKRISC